MTAVIRRSYAMSFSSCSRFCTIWSLRSVNAAARAPYVLRSLTPSLLLSRCFCAAASLALRWMSFSMSMAVMFCCCSAAAPFSRM